ncbi:MAG: translational GTPase TypA [Verrucomicrobia bacterium Tous-C9LFEB]|nr:MAG: translational GTPase TypA [Verrucomicrobia bacterium Tous-C9LFEB]
MEKIRNIAIIAHVDHGKTTLVDQLLRQSGTFRSNQAVVERVMDSMDLEREKGITIKAKNAAYQYNGYHVNIVDTPGHADFGGEVERILKMIDGVLLVVDAFDGPQAQTKFVLRKALEAGARPIVVINKIDRENARPHKVLDMVFELFLELNATDEQLDFPVVYASAKLGFAVKEWVGSVDEATKNAGMTALYDTIIEKIPAPQADPTKHFEMVVANLDYSEYYGRISLGKIYGGTVRMGDKIVCLRKGGAVSKGTVTKILSHQGLQRIEIQEAHAGDIVGIAGVEEVFIGETLTDSEDREPLPFVDIDPPTIKMQFVVNDSPLAGREGKFLTARHIRDRLIRETRTNVSIQVEDTNQAGVFQVSARGEMQIAILVEQMRREGFEVMVSRPEVIFHKAENGDTLEPIETLYVDVPTDKLGDILQNLANRKGEITNMVHNPTTVAVEANIPTRGLIGFETDLVNLTRGEGIMSHLFKEYGPMRGEIATRLNGVLVSMETGEATAFALNNIQVRGTLFVKPGDAIYAGMVVGENARPDDMAVNPCKEKHLTNMRSQGDGKGIQLDTPVTLSLERALEYIANDEYVEATPLSLRLRKRILDENKRRRAESKQPA